MALSASPRHRAELWTRAGHVKIKVGKKVDIRRLDMLIAHSVIGSQN